MDKVWRTGFLPWMPALLHGIRYRMNFDKHLLLEEEEEEQEEEQEQDFRIDR